MDEDISLLKDSALVAEAQMLYRSVLEEYGNLHTYSSIMAISEMAESFGNRWQNLDKMCTNDPDFVIERLLNLKYHDLATEVVEIYQNRRMLSAIDVSESNQHGEIEKWKLKTKTRIRQSHVLHLLVKIKNPRKAFSILERISSKNESLMIAHNVLGLVEDLGTKLLLAQFIINNCAAMNVSAESFPLLEQVHVVELSLKILIKIPAGYNMKICILLAILN